MKQPKLKLGFSSYSDARLVEIGASIKDGMGGNPNFPGIEANVDSYIASYDAFVASIPPSNIRNQVNVAIKDSNRAACEAEAKSLGYLCMSMAGGNLSFLETTGFPMSNKPTKKPLPSAPSAVEVFVTPDPNSVMVSCQRNTNADTYEARVSVDKSNWQWSNYGTSCKVTVTGVPTGVEIFVQMRCRNAAGTSGWSNPVMTRLPLPTEPTLKYVGM